MEIATGEVSNSFLTSMVLDDQVFGMSVVAQHQLEVRREILTADGVEDDTRVVTNSNFDHSYFTLMSRDL